MVAAKFAKKITKKNWKGYIYRCFPIVRWLPNYKIQDLRYDIIAGLTVGLTLVPQSMAYSQMCSVSPQYGLYSSFIGQFIYVVLGTAKDAAIGPSAIVSMMVGGMNSANPLIKTGDNTYSCIMAFISGPILILIGILKLGFFVNLFSIPVVSGFTSAAGFSIIASQLRPFFGLKDAPNDTPAVFVKQIQNVVDRRSEIKTYDVAFGLSSIGFLVSMQYMPDIVDVIIRKINKRKKDNEKLTTGQINFMEYLRLFAASRNVFVFVFTTLAAYMLISADPSVENRLSVVRKIPSGLPPPRFPTMELATTSINNETNETTYTVIRTTSDIFQDLTVSFVIMPLMIMLEQFAILKSLGRKNGYRIDPTNELITIGIVNFVQSFFQAFPVTAAVTRCALNDQCKVKTQLASVLSGIIVIIAVFALTSTFYYISKAALAGIIIIAAYNLVDFKIILHMWREYKRDVFILILTFLLCLFFDMAYGILIMIFVNMITFLRPIVRMAIYVKQEVKTDETSGKNSTIQIIKLSHGMKYPSADKFLDRVARVLAKADKHVVLDCQFFTGIDYTGLQAIRGILLLAFRQNKHLIFTNMSERLQEKVEKIGLDHWQYVDSVTDAVQRYNSDEASSIARDVSIVDNSDAINRQGGTTRHRLASFATQGRQSSRPKTRNNSLIDISDQPIDYDDWQKKQDDILRQLTGGQAYFYQDIPISVGNVADFSGFDHPGDEANNDNEDSSDDENVKVVADYDVEVEASLANRPKGITHSKSVTVDSSLTRPIPTITEDVPYFGDYSASARASLRTYSRSPASAATFRKKSVSHNLVANSGNNVESNTLAQRQTTATVSHENRGYENSPEEQATEKL